jgi:hypothetical protein
VILDQKLASGLVGPFLKLPKQFGHLSQIKVVNCEPLMNGRLDGVGDAAKMVPKLFLNPAQSGIQESWVGQHKLEQKAAELIKAVLDSHEVLGEILDHLKSLLVTFLFWNNSPQRDSIWAWLKRPMAVAATAKGRPLPNWYHVV